MKKRSSTAQMFRYVRLQQRASYRAFAKRFGLHHSTLHRIERDERKPPPGALRMLVYLSECQSLEELMKCVNNKLNL